jgi:hypothetical protein
MNRKPVYFGAKKRIISCPNGRLRAAGILVPFLDGLVAERSHLAGVRAFMNGAGLRGQFEAKADSAEVHRHPWRWRSLPALRHADANQRVC